MPRPSTMSYIKAQVTHDELADVRRLCDLTPIQYRKGSRPKSVQQFASEAIRQKISRDTAAGQGLADPVPPPEQRKAK